MISETLKDITYKIIGNKKQTSPDASGDYLSSLKDWFVSEYPDAVFHEATYTESAYIYIDNLKIRFSDHIQNNMSNKDLYVVKTGDKSNIFMVMIQHSKKPYTMDYDELKSFIKHYLMINDATETAKAAEDISTKIRESVHKVSPSIPVKKQPKLAVDSTSYAPYSIAADVANVKFHIFQREFNTNEYININWKAFEQQCLIKDLSWYGNMNRNDERRNLMNTIVSKCAFGGLSYKQTLKFIGNARTKEELTELRNKSHDLYDSFSQKTKRLCEKYQTLVNRNEDWDGFMTSLIKLIPWFDDIAKTNKETIISYFKRDYPTFLIIKTLNKIHEQFGNMKYGACIAFKAAMKEKQEAYKEKQEAYKEKQEAQA